MVGFFFPPASPLVRTTRRRPLPIQCVSERSRGLLGAHDVRSFLKRQFISRCRCKRHSFTTRVGFHVCKLYPPAKCEQRCASSTNKTAAVYANIKAKRYGVRERQPLCKTAELPPSWRWQSSRQLSSKSVPESCH